ncbi:tRNA (guanine-N(7)-)-methyltransferase non-catalytic subunit wdr4-like [Bombina bombina]|uniref:tRNA (guanine-N(7)-)-methyltransferase non-catalytic subunit wdr4-like n=1 Tax=Bombina bombina TaxID=8345 RepID=UPI00235A6814|nr:tRNA (guanine-N(7)-)-methyltransferase non-catalytic subunit wdr4-like [Bombina bombina]
MLRVRAGRVGLCAGSVVLGHTQDQTGGCFLFDCSLLEKQPPNPGQDAAVDSSGSDRILAAAFSPNGGFFAVTDDSKRLVVFRTQPSWEKVSVRWVSRRCTALTFSASGKRVLVADKSGDVISFSVTEPNTAGRLELGHLSMLLDVVVSPDGRHIITGDRDEKIRVSRVDAPHVISSFCLGHEEFVSQLLPLPGNRKLLLSGSGDGSLRLWEYETGRQVQRLDLSRVRESVEVQGKTTYAVSKISCSGCGEHVAVLCDGLPGMYLFRVPGGTSLLHAQYIALSRAPWDLEFDESATLWLLTGVQEEPLIQYTLTEGLWQPVHVNDGLLAISNVVKENWKRAEDSVKAENRFDGLYKVVFDNMATYLRKKEDRLEKEKRKVTSKLVEPVSKVLKTN